MQPGHAYCVARIVPEMAFVVLVNPNKSAQYRGPLSHSDTKFTTAMRAASASVTNFGVFIHGCRSQAPQGMSRCRLRILLPKVSYRAGTLFPIFQEHTELLLLRPISGGALFGGQ